MIKIPTPFFFRQMKYYLMLHLALVASMIYAQSSPISFNVDRSLKVENNVVLLQATKPLNLTQLYHLHTDAPQGILMHPLPGGRSKVEVRVFSYQDQKKGDLIYAAVGTESGWNQSNWDAASSLFEDDAKPSAKVIDFLNIGDGPYKTTDIKVLSQFSNLNSVCPGKKNSEYTYKDGALGNVNVPMASFGSSEAARVTRDDDDGDEEEHKNNCKEYKNKEAYKRKADDAARKAVLSKAEAEAKEKEKKTAEAMVSEAVKRVYQTTRDYNNARYAAEDANREADEAKKAAEKARAKADEAAKADFDKTKAEAKADAAEKEADEKYQMFEEAQREAEKKTKEAAIAAKAAEAAAKVVDDTKIVVTESDPQIKKAFAAASATSARLEGHKALLETTYTEFLVAREARQNALQAYQIAYANFRQTDPRNNEAVQQASQAMFEAEVALNRAEQRFNTAIQHRANAQANVDAAQAAVNTAQSNLEAAYNANEAMQKARANADDAKRKADDAARAKKVAEWDVEMARSQALNAQIRADKARAEANINPEEVIAAAQKAAEEAERYLDEAKKAADKAKKAAEDAQKVLEEATAALKEAKIAYMKASADVVDANHRYEDDEDGAAGAVATEQVAEYVDDDSDNNYPNPLMAILKIFGYSYIEDSFFHDPSLTEEGIESFQASYEQCATEATGDWCAMTSPMPLVLIEALVYNATLDKITIPGVEIMAADEFFPQSPIHDNDQKAQYIPVAKADQSVANGYPIVEAPFPTEGNMPGFPKVDHIKVPDFSNNNMVTQELKVDNWGRVLLAGTEGRFTSLRKTLDEQAKGSGVRPDQYFSLTPLSHDFMTVGLASHGAKRDAQSEDALRYELWSLIINKEFADGCTIVVTPEGPFEASNGKNEQTQAQPPLPNHEIFGRELQHQDFLIDEKESDVPDEPGSIVVYPNPTRGVVNIGFTLAESSLVKLRVTDVFGNIVYEETERGLEPGTYSRAIDFKRKWASGMYVISISTNHGRQTVKVLVE